jgi:hypothetical protein
VLNDPPTMPGWPIHDGFIVMSGKKKFNQRRSLNACLCHQEHVISTEGAPLRRSGETPVFDRSHYIVSSGPDSYSATIAFFLSALCVRRCFRDLLIKSLL